MVLISLVIMCNIQTFVCIVSELNVLWGNSFVDNNTK